MHDPDTNPLTFGVQYTTKNRENLFNRALKLTK
jgi:hypothetical protein